MRKQHQEVCRLMDTSPLRLDGDGREYQAHVRWLASLLALRRDEKALALAERLGGSYYMLWAQAASGRVEEAMTTFEACLGEGWTRDQLYSDGVLGPHLASEAMRALREKFPRD